ncbi:sulfotransferase protein [Rhodopirellula islandica]|uniref:Sulfotransferase protein n=1 Tax=Rhodopirellula islandica TaxID=595434 RepID=A0A0J1B6T8_RHOIS|nr:sulfotransferase [Rhodopirellula islandica]KLU02540.1 sulfotransferase protein [Rhodopirellula islandica]
MKLPDFLIIGAMKAGTTTLYRDLYEHPSVFLPESKEPDDLASDDVLSEAGLANYARLFSSAKADQICGEASTSYTKRPRYEGAAERAVRCLGPDVKLIYIVRDPIRRILSQYHHEFQQEKAGADIDQELSIDSRFVWFSRYFHQISPWVEQFGRNSILVVQFEHYVANRVETLDQITDFLVVPRYTWPDSKGAAFNASSGKPMIRNPLLKRFRDSDVYQRRIKMFFPWHLRRSLSQKLFRPSRVQVPEPREGTLDRIRSVISDDQQKFNELGLKHLGLIRD